MKLLELNLPDATAAKLEEKARSVGLTAEQLAVLSLIERFETSDAELQLDSAFEAAADYLIDKNEELHKRLA
jgi:hypothetical protein